MTDRTDKADKMLPLCEISTPALAYLGDCVMEHCVRRRLVCRGYSSSGKLNDEALKYVRATAQAAAAEKILPILSEEEALVFRRGRNIGHTNLPKSATMAEYRSATGLETLFGWLDLQSRQERIEELFEKAYPMGEETESAR